MSKIKQLNQFFQTDIWRIRASKLSRRRSFFIMQLRIFLLALREFSENKCQLRASALTFYSLISFAPVLAMFFGITNGFGLNLELQEQLLGRFPHQEEIILQMIVFAHTFLENTHGSLIAGISVAVLVWIVVQVLSNVEDAFNDMWGVKKCRAWTRKLTDYTSLVVIIPMLLIISGSILVFVSQPDFADRYLSFLGWLSPVIVWFLKLLPNAIIWALFTFLYMFMPNTKVHFGAALIGGLIGALVFQLMQVLYFLFQVSVFKFGSIYGSFAALPIFLVWLQLSWLTVLFGAEVTFAQQNVQTYEFELDSAQASLSFKRLVALSIVHLCVKNFHQASPALTAQQIAEQLEVPLRLVNQTLFELVETGILSGVNVQEGKFLTYQPGRDIGQLTIGTVIALLDQRGVKDIPFAQTEGIRQIQRSLLAREKIFEQSPANVALKDIE